MATLRMNILLQVAQFSSLLNFPITFISMAIVQYYHRISQDVTIVTTLVILFWTVPPIILIVGIYFTHKYRRYMFLKKVYYLYNFTNLILLASLGIYSLSTNSYVSLSTTLLTFITKAVTSPTFWINFVANSALCNVVISDMLYIAIF